MTSSLYRPGEWMPLATEFHCVAHEDRSGRPRLNDRILGLGLAAALLGELVFAGRLGLVNGQVHLLSHKPLEEPVGQWVLSLLAENPVLQDTHTWLRYFAGSAEQRVLSRLVAARIWRQHVTRSWVGATRVRHVLGDPDAVFYRSVRLARLLGSLDAMTTEDVVLAGLVQATGLVSVLPWDSPADRARATYRLTTEVEVLPQPLRWLMASTEVVVGAAVLAPH